MLSWRTDACVRYDSVRRVPQYAEDLLAEKTIPDTLRRILAFFTQGRLATVTKTEVVSVTVPPDLKAALITAAQ